MHGLDRAFPGFRSSNVRRAGALLAGLLVSASVPAAWAVPVLYDLTVAGGGGTFSVEAPADPTFSGLAPLLSFDLTADFDAVFPATGETVSLTVTLADFDSAADQPQASFDTGVVTHLVVNGGSGTTVDGAANQFDLLFFFDDNEANLQAFRVADSVLFDACCGFTVTLSEQPPGPVIPEPSALLAFALGIGVVSSRLRA